jgi:hydrogenase nickel incorporation protein HypB
MSGINLVKIREEILSESDEHGDAIRERMKEECTFFVNLMASPGAGKTSLLLHTIERLKDSTRICIIEGDIESKIDSKKISDAGVRAVQIETGGACHLDSPMIQAALALLDGEIFDLLVVENIGNLVCPAEFDIGEDRKVMILSVPEGHDKIFKYPLMFSVCNALIINKTDYLNGSDFDMDALEGAMAKLNPEAEIFKVSCKTGEGIDEWCQWLIKEMKTKGDGCNGKMERSRAME